MNNIPKISVVMSVFNTEKYLTEAIESILHQTFTDFEFIIIDDGSTDKSAEIICSYVDPRIRLLQQENRGLPASLNRGIKLSKAEYIARMDADDISESSRLEEQIRYLDRNPNCVLVGTSGCYIDIEGQVLGKLQKPVDQDAIQKELERGSSPFIHGSVMFRKEVACRCGSYNEQMVFAEDWDLWLRMIHFGKMTNLTDNLFRHRLSPEAVTTITPKKQKIKNTVLRKVVTNGEPQKEDILRLRLLKKNISPRRRWALYHLKAGKALIERNWQPVRARRHIWKSLCCYPYNIIAWINLAFCFLPRKWVRIWKRWRTKQSCS